MIAALDAHYDEDTLAAVAAAVVFGHWDDAAPALALPRWMFDFAPGNGLQHYCRSASFRSLSFSTSLNSRQSTSKSPAASPQSRFRLALGCLSLTSL